jgi:endonuclease/exonuclease/phosphatase family metal-dependent hydrolase
MLRVATFNIHHGLGADGKLDLERTADTIVGLGAEVVSLQEVDRGWARSGSVDQVALLERLTGMRIVFYPSITKDDGATYGIAMATSAPAEIIPLQLPRRAEEEPRMAMIVKLGHVTILGAHLSRNPAARPAQIEVLADEVRAIDGPVVLAGDLNTTIGHLRPLLLAGLERGPRPRRTVPARLPRAAVDHILAGKGARVETLKAPRSWASDHRPLVAEVAL